MQTTLGNMLSIISAPFGRKLTRDRAYLLRQANRIREMFYNLYREYEIEVDITECFEVQGFRQCGLCCEAFTGLTLPSYMNAVEAAWLNQTPINLYSKWREAKVGLKGRGNFLASYDMRGSFPTERDICAENGSYLSVEATNPQDAGKEVEITYVDPSGASRRESIELPAGGGLSTEDLATAITSVVLPADRQGTIVLKERCTGRVLSEYLPYESVPSYRRIKLTGVCAGNQVVIAANRRYHPVYWDTDIVESGNQEALINAALHIFYADSGSGSDNIQKAEYHRGLMRDALKGETARDQPVNRENDTGRFGPPVRGSRLYRGRGVA